MTLPRRPLGTTGLSVSSLGLAGSFGIDADATQRAFHELGVNYFFVSTRMPKLVDGVAQLVKQGHRGEMVIASGANVPTGGSVRRSWAKNARALGVDRIDIWHLFWVQAHWYVTGKTWTEMLRLKEEGKVGALAISCHDRTLARRLQTELGLDVMMLRYNAAHRGVEKEVFDHLPAPRPGIVAYTATRWGKLLAPVDGLGPMTAAECYRFVLGHPAVDVALCGARSFEELAEDAAAVQAGPLSATRLAEVLAFGDRVRSTFASRVAFRG